MSAESQALEDLLREMHREDNEMVVVVDEHGGAVGVLTFEDIVEEIVGEIRDEDDHEALPYKEISPSSWLIQARMEIQQINEHLKIEVPQGEYETLSGFCYSNLEGYQSRRRAFLRLILDLFVL